MSVLFLDTSALLKLYLPETGSSWLKTFIMGHNLVISELALYESATVLRRRYLEGSLTLLQASTLHVGLQRDSLAYITIPLNAERQLERVINFAFKLPTALRLRALDAIQLAAAEIANELSQTQTPPDQFMFISSDKQFLQVAQAQNFLTENPEDHP